MLIGVVSDTHGYLNPRVPELLQGVDHILHAGDIGDGGIIESLSEIAPVTVVRGNNDRTGPESLYPKEVSLRLEGFGFYLTHIIKPPKKPDDPAITVYRQQAVDIVVYGHSHIAYQQNIGNILFFNPGAAGKRRFKVVPSIGFLELDDGRVNGTIAAL